MGSSKEISSPVSTRISRGISTLGWRLWRMIRFFFLIDSRAYIAAPMAAQTGSSNFDVRKDIQDKPF